MALFSTKTKNANVWSCWVRVYNTGQLWRIMAGLACMQESCHCLLAQAMLVCKNHASKLGLLMQESCQSKGQNLPLVFGRKTCGLRKVGFANFIRQRVGFANLALPKESDQNLGSAKLLSKETWRQNSFARKLFAKKLSWPKTIWPKSAFLAIVASPTTGLRQSCLSPPCARPNFGRKNLCPAPTSAHQLHLAPSIMPLNRAQTAFCAPNFLRPPLNHIKSGLRQRD